MKQNIKYFELGLLIIAFACCFIPCVVYKNDMIVDIYVFDANAIMGYSFMSLMIFGIVYKIILTKEKKEDSCFINKYFSLIIMIIGTILYTVSCLLRRNIWIKFSLGFYVVLACLLLMIVLFITKSITSKKSKKKKIKKN